MPLSKEDIMNLSTIIIGLVLLSIVTLIILYIVKSKRKGECIGCPNAAVCPHRMAALGNACSGNCAACAGCTHTTEKNLISN